MKGRYFFFIITAIVLPFIILMNGVMLVFTPEFLRYEYRRPDFPPDRFGFTLEERDEYGTASVNYITDVLNRIPDDYLAQLTMKDGTPLYNERELSHMYDVRVVFQSCRSAMALMIVFIILTGFLVSSKPDSLPGFLKSLGFGSMLTLLLIALVGLGIVTGFDAFFDGFHHIFFTGDSWLFYESDSLIRLFPEPLWVNGFSYAAILAAVIAAVILLITVLASKKVTLKSKKR